MARYVAFLRAINVGGHVVKMDRLRVLFEEIGLANVKTFIASGNVLFESSEKNASTLEDKVAKALRDALGYEVAVFIRTAAEIGAIATQGDGVLAEGSLFVGFLPAPLDAREKKIVDSLRTPVDDLRVHKREIYWRATQNFRGALFQPAKLEKLLGKPATFRNVTTVRRIAALLVKPLLLLALLAPLHVEAQVPGRPPSQIVARRVTLVRDWASAVRRHTPGEVDAALLVTSAWTSDDIRDVWVGVNVLNTLLRAPTASELFVLIAGAKMRIDMERQDRQALRNLAEDLLRLPGADSFRKSAAIFHMDAAMLLVGDSATSPIYSSFLLPRRIVVRTGDGKQDSVHGGDVNWEFARVILDAVRQPGEDADVRLWYQATLAYKLSHEQLDTPHFDRALQLFSTDSNILFLNGALHDAFADPRVQAVVRAADLPRGARLDVASEEAQLRKAAGLYRRALAVDSAHVEAAVRYARVLGRLGQHTEALTHLRAIRAATDPVLDYYAQLFLGLEEEALGRYGDARTAYEKAIAIFPRAQAPRLALSQLAHRTGDRVAAREALEPVLQRWGEGVSDDPWWIYRLTAGRQANDLIAAVHRAIAPGGSQ